MLPRLHLVTNDAVLRGADFRARAQRVLAVHGERVALQLRGHGLEGRELFALAADLAFAADAAGATVLVNDRVDVALAAGVDGVQLGRRSLPVDRVRELLGADAWIGYSAHAAEEAAVAVEAGADFTLVGTIYSSASHPRARPAGPWRIRRAVRAAAAPVLAIGGVTPARVPEVRRAGAYGVAVIRGVWDAEDPADAAGSYLAMLHDEGGGDDEDIDG